MVDADANGSSLTEVDESGYQLVLPSGTYGWFLYTNYNTMLVDFYRTQ